MKKLLAFILSFSMLLTMCISTSGFKTGSKVTISNSPKVTLKILMASANVATNGIQTDPVSREIERVTGVTMDITVLNGNDYDARLAALTASADLPDIVGVYNDKNRTILLNSKSLIDLNSLVKTNGQNFLNNKKLAFAVNFNKKYKGGNTGKLFYMPLVVGNQADVLNPVVGPFIRWDYYKELGYPKCDNLDDLLNVLGKMQAKHPKAENGKKAYGVSFFTDWGLWCISAATMIDGYTNQSILNIDISNDNAPTSLYTDKTNAFWKWIKFYYNANQKGILDPDSITMKFSDYNDKFVAGQTYMVLPGWLPHNFVGKTPNQGFAPVKLNPTSNKYDYNYGVANGQDQLGITTSCKTPERAMDLLNYFASNEGMETLVNGVKGQTWDVVNGKPVVKQSIIDEQNKHDAGFIDKYGMNKYPHLAALYSPEIDINYNTPFDFQKSTAVLSKSLTPYEKDQTKHYNVSLPGQIFSGKKYNMYLGAPGAALPVISKDMKVIEDKVNTYSQTAIFTMIISKNDAAFKTAQDKFISNLKGMGYDKLLKYYQDNWKKVKAELNSFSN